MMTQEQEIKALRNALGTLITWMAQSANSPIRVNEAERILKMMDGGE